MRLVALMLTRNGAWSLRATAPAALTYCDDLVLSLHRCEDESAQIAADLAAAHPGRVHVLYRDDEVWPEIEHRAATLAEARKIGATHALVIDDDDLLSTNLVDRVREQTARVPPGGYMIAPRWRVVSRESADQVRWVTAAWGMADGLGYAPIALHESPRHPRLDNAVGQWTAGLTDGGMLHLSGLQSGGEAARIAYYRMQARLRCPDLPLEAIHQRYRLDRPDGVLTPVPASWWPTGAWEQIDWQRPLWQAVECRRLLARYGAERFAGIDLLGADRSAA